MDYDLNRKILLTTEREHKALYKWSLQELDEKGNKIGSDQIPWAWSNSFSGKKISYGIWFKGEMDNLSLTQYTRSPLTKSKGGYKFISNTAENIRVQLFSTNNETKYSMFGTEREIADISLSIYRAEEESCSAWGFPSYEAEIDFSYHTEPDCLGFSLNLTPTNFDKLIDLIKLNGISQINFRVRGVKGFYSSWSPSISTNKVKVLCSVSDHEVDVDDTCELTAAQQKNIPRLGEIIDYELSVVSIQDKYLTQSLNDYEDDVEIEDAHKNSGSFNSPHLVKLLQQQKQFFIVIAILLFLILIVK